LGEIVSVIRKCNIAEVVKVHPPPWQVILRSTLLLQHIRHTFSLPLY